MIFDCFQYNALGYSVEYDALGINIKPLNLS